MTKELAAVLLSMFLLFSLASCKSNIKDTSETETNSAVVSENEAEQPFGLEETAQVETNQARDADETTIKQTEATTFASTTVSTNRTTTVKQNTTTTTKPTTARTATTTTTTTTKSNIPKPNYNVNSSNSNVKAVYNLVNQERSNNGLDKLSYRNDLQSAADKRAKEIVSSFSHTRPNGSTCFTAIKEAGVSYSAAGENFGKTNGENSDMMNWWMDSSAHKANILSAKYTGIAIGCCEQDGYRYYVQIFVS